MDVVKVVGSVEPVLFGGIVQDELDVVGDPGMRLVVRFTDVTWIYGDTIGDIPIGLYRAEIRSDDLETISMLLDT